MSPQRLSRVIAVASTILALGGLGLTLAGGPLLLLWGAAGLALTLLLSRWFSVGFALAAAVIGMLCVELGLLHLSQAAGGPAIAFECSTWTPVALLASLAAFVWPPRIRAPRRSDWLLPLAASAGSILTIVGFTVAAVLPKSVHIAWAMNEDGGNDIATARGLLSQGGIPIDSGALPQLPFGVLASALAPGRAAVQPGALLLFDVTRMSQLWVAILALTCLLIGMIVASATRGARLPIAVAATTVGSLSGMSWWVTGIQLTGGFINAGFAILILLALWLAFLEGTAHPIPALVATAGGVVVLLSTWSPLAACSIGLVAVLCGRVIRSRFGARVLWVSAGVVLVAAVAGIAIALPRLLSDWALLRTEGGFPDISSPAILVVVMVVVAILLVEAMRATRNLPAAGALAVLVGTVLGFALLLYIRRDRQDLVGYYPQKYAWMASILLLVVAATLLARSLIDRPPARPRAMGIAAIVAGALLAGGVAVGGFAHEFPIVGILAGEFNGVGNAESDEVLKLVAEHVPYRQGESTSGSHGWAVYYLYSLSGNGGSTGTG